VLTAELVKLIPLFVVFMQQDANNKKEEYYFLECDTMMSGRSLSTFWRKCLHTQGQRAR
jgi:hypothetical protein